MSNSNPDIKNYTNPKASHTGGIIFSSNAVGGRKRSTRYNKSKLRRKHTKKQSRRYRRTRSRSKSKSISRKQLGGMNPSPTYTAYSTSFEPGKNGMYANGPSVGTIIQKFN